jgi:hypothetical protein
MLWAMKSHIALLRLALVLVLATAGGSCAGTAPPDKGAQTQEEVMKNVEGPWEGTNTLWLKYPEDPQESAARMVVSPGRVEYSWAYQDEPQTGTFVFSGSGGQLTAQWTDTWHAKDSMACSGTEQDGVVIVTGTYAAGDGPDWSWRTELRLDAPDKLKMKMYNILPDSLLADQAERELLAVHMDLTRAPSQ